MQDTKSPKGLTRRELLSRATAAGASFVIGAGYVAGRDAAWATEMNAMKPESFATLAQMARDIYPHDQVADQYYAAAIKGYDTQEQAEMAEAGLGKLNTLAREMKGSDYIDIGWEADRVEVLRAMQDDPFFQTVRGGLVTGLYNQKEIWPIFGYEGESYSQGGYINRGFDDIAWIG
ncbi:Twin-arginine translocation pathway signal [Maribius pontilimi]|uniref:Twin-arginine translocation pathway signal n=1 Tax=Palleronia pontilimi TaxID=1964209 RepID=A0A934I6V9_9RHOB|nr:Twin-arginine translocation pathway signal [Palleronia pontilimi]MBJ3761288.1 Twin-arginine translocation pathway signal [Palleronia pontilimi]